MSGHFGPRQAPRPSWSVRPAAILVRTVSPSTARRVRKRRRLKKGNPLRSTHAQWRREEARWKLVPGTEAWVTEKTAQLAVNGYRPAKKDREDLVSYGLLTEEQCNDWDRVEQRSKS
jgi:hypothetical protein